MKAPSLGLPERTCDDCGNLLHEGETCDCQDEEGTEDDWCPVCHGTGEGAFGHRCYHNNMKTFSETQRDLFLHRGDRD